jgi:hypothetical protein
MRASLSVLVLAIVIAGCSKKKEAAPAPAPEPKTTEAPKQQPPPSPGADDDEKPTPTESEPAAGAPSKEAAILRLKEVLAALEAKDWQKAVGYFAFPAAERPRSIESQFAKLIELKEISAKGIDILAAKGKWGKLAEVFEPERAQAWAQKFAVNVDECYGMSLDNASVGFHWDGTELKLIRLNNVGKLE